MAIKTVPLSELEADVRKMLNACADSGVAMVVELPDRRLIALQPLESPVPPPTLEELVAGITDENRHDEVRTGPAMGGEVW